MKVSFDPVADAMYIYFSTKKKSTRTEEVSDDLLVDFAGSELVGIEVLGVSSKLPKEDLKSIVAVPPTFAGKILRSA